MRGKTGFRLAGAALFVALTGSNAMAGFGAIAFSPSSSSYGYSYGHPSRAAAESRAYGECAARSGGCQVVLWFQSACGALAQGYNGWGSAWGNSRAQAERNAIAQCSRHTGGCGILAWVCTD